MSRTNHFSEGFHEALASELAWGQSGIILRCSIPFSRMYCLISSLVKGGPLSLLTTCGSPWVEKILSNFGVTQLADVERTISTSGNHEYASMITNKYSPEGKGPQNSMWTVCQGSGVKGDIWRESGWILGLLAWHATHLSIILFTASSIPENQIFSCRSCFVFY